MDSDETVLRALGLVRAEPPLAEQLEQLAAGEQVAGEPAHGDLADLAELEVGVADARS